MAKAQSKNHKNTMSIVKNIGFGLICIVLGYVLIGNLAANNSTIYGISHYMNVVVLTGSMEPEIKPGDYITVIKKDKDSYKVGDVVTYLRTTDSGEKEKVTHQIISIDGDQVITQGISSSNTNADTPITKDDIIGKHIITIPKLGWVMKFLSSTTGIILIVGLILAVIFWEITEPKKDEEEETVQYSKQPAVENNPKKRKLPFNLNKKAEVQEEPVMETVKEVAATQNVVKNQEEIPKAESIVKEEKKHVKAEPAIEDDDDRIDLITELTKLREEKKKILDAQKLLDEARKKELEEMNMKLESALEENNNITKMSKRNASPFQNNMAMGQGMQQSQNPYMQQNGYAQQPNPYMQQNGNINQQNGYTQQSNPYMQQDGNMNQQNSYVQQPNPYTQQDGNINQQNGYAQQSNPYMQQDNNINQQNGYMQQQNPYVQQDVNLNQPNGYMNQQNVNNGYAQQNPYMQQEQNQQNPAQQGIVQQSSPFNSQGLNPFEAPKAEVKKAQPQKPKNDRTLKLIRTLAGINITSADIVKATGIALEKVNRLRDSDRIITIAKNLLDMNMEMDEVVLATGLSKERLQQIISEEASVSFDESWEDERVLNIARKLIDKNMSLDKIAKATGLKATRVEKIKEQYRVISIAKNLYSMGMGYEEIAHATALTVAEAKSCISENVLNYEEYQENTIADVVRNLLTMEMPMANIIKATGLTLEEIRTVKEDIEMEAIAKNLIDMKISSKYIAEATGLAISRIMKLKGNDDIIEIAKKLLQMGLAQEEVSEIVNLPLDVISVIQVDPIKNKGVISIDFGAVK